MAVLTPSVAQKEIFNVQDAITGTPVAVVRYRLKVTKAAQNDTIEVDTSLGIVTSDIIGMYGLTIPTSGDSVQEGPTIDDSDDEIVLPSATIGTTWVTIDVISN